MPGNTLSSHIGVQIAEDCGMQPGCVVDLFIVDDYSTMRVGFAELQDVGP